MALHSGIFALFLTILLACQDKVFAADWVFDNSATYEHASHQAQIRWPEGNFSKFIDSNRFEVAQLEIPDLDKKRPITVDLDELTGGTQVILLVHDRGSNRGVADFYSSESGTYQGPQLSLSGQEKSSLIPVDLDTYIIAKNRKPMGKEKILKVGANHLVFLVFKLPKQWQSSTVRSAQLLLNVTDRQYGPSKLTVSQLRYVAKQQERRDDGIASKYLVDQGISNDKDVFYADDFDNRGWFSKIQQKTGLTQPVWDNTGEQRFIEHSEINHYAKKDGKSLIIPFRTSANLAGNLDYYFAKHAGFEPEEAYFRYYSMLQPGAQVSGGGKLPGFGGTYNRAGWGGRANNGENGWSARGAFFKTIGNGNPELGGRMPIGSYLYEADTSKKYGETFAWGDTRAAMEPGKWYCIEQHLKLNTPGQADGLLEVWIDGYLVYRDNKLNFRSTDKLKIEKIWMNYYFGGVAKPQSDFNMYVDNIVIASSYIGPIRQ